MNCSSHRHAKPTLNAAARFSGKSKRYSPSNCRSFRSLHAILRWGPISASATTVRARSCLIRFGMQKNCLSAETPDQYRERQRACLPALNQREFDISEHYSRFPVYEKTSTGVAQTVQFALVPRQASAGNHANWTVCATPAETGIAPGPTHLAYLLVFVPLLRRTHVKSEQKRFPTTTK